MINKRTMPNMARVLTLFFSLALVASLVPATAFAGSAKSPSQEGDLTAQATASGTSGSCSWSIDNGRLAVRPTSGKSGTLNDMNGTAPWAVHAADITSVVIAPGVSGSGSLGGMFAGCKNLTTLDLSGLSTSGIWDMSRMFAECAALPSLNLDDFDTSATTNMKEMFDGCARLTSLGLTRFNTSNVTDMAGMFRECVSMASIDLSRFDTSKVQDMSDMFSGCSALTSLSLGNFDTSSVTNMQRMFSSLTLKELDLSSFNTPELKDMWGMFYGCASLATLNIANIDTSKVTSMGYVFDGCDALERVSLGAGFAFEDEASELPNVSWLSSVTGRSYSAHHIATERNNVADVYVRSKPATPGPSIVAGAETIWVKGSGKDALFRSNASVEDFVCVRIDNVVIPSSNYEVSGNQTNVKLKAAYLETLSVDGHEIEILSATGTASTTFTVSDDPALSDPVNMYRLYNPNSGEHFYTASEYERDHLVSEGWTYERIGWVAPRGGDPVYRLYNPNAGEHHYTKDAGERDILVSLGWNDEGIGWHTAGSVPLYRQYNPNAYANNHNYTSSEVERDHLLSVGWRDEGIGWYGIG